MLIKVKYACLSRFHHYHRRRRRRLRLRLQR